MKVKWELNDRDNEYGGLREYELTPRFQAALIEVMKAEVAMMREQDDKYSDCWHWGRCYLRDLSGGPHFTYGEAGDEPDDGLGQFGIIIDESDRYAP